VQAASDGKPAEIQRLLAEGIDVNAKAADGVTVLLGIHRTGLYRKMKRHGLDSAPAI
jgi:transcriptional regulator of acetoin/glycerol metabolism